MVIKILEYDPVSGRGKYKMTNGQTASFRYTLFKNKAIWAGHLARLENNKILQAKWYDRIAWAVRRVMSWQ